MFKYMKPGTTAVPATHSAQDGTLVDFVNPLALPGDSLTAGAKAAVVGVAAWVGRGYRDNKNFSF